MASFQRLILELSGRCDRTAVVAFLERAAGVQASEIELDLTGARDLAPPTLRLLAVSIRRYHAGRKIMVRGLVARDAAALIRLGVSAKVLISIRADPVPISPFDFA